MITSYPDEFPIDYIVFKHHQDETLLFYHKSHQFLMNSLLPYHEAQALHPLPYVDHSLATSSDPDDQAEYEHTSYDQIYNAAWNGFILGYPERFIQYYCEEFAHNKLTKSRRLEIFHEAKEHVQAHFATAIGGWTPYEIHYGYIPMNETKQLEWLQKIEQIALTL